MRTQTSIHGANALRVTAHRYGEGSGLSALPFLPGGWLDFVFESTDGSTFTLHVHADTEAAFERLRELAPPSLARPAPVVLDPELPF